MSTLDISKLRTLSDQRNGNIQSTIAYNNTLSNGHVAQRAIPGSTSLSNSNLANGTATRNVENGGVHQSQDTHNTVPQNTRGIN